MMDPDISRPAPSPRASAVASSAERSAPSPPERRFHSAMTDAGSTVRAVPSSPVSMVAIMSTIPSRR
jgi:hypothetical protein